MQAFRYFDSWNCVAFSLLNSIEIYFNYLLAFNLISEENLQWLKDNQYYQYGQINFSDRWTGAKAGTVIGRGNSGWNVKKAVDNWGLVPEVLWAMNKEMHADEYYIKPPTALDELGKEFQKRFKINIESFWLKDLKEVMKIAVPQVFVRAWYRNEDGIYYNTDAKKCNHAVVKVDKNIIFDHYDPFTKTLTEDYAYWASGYYATVQEVITEKYMNIEKFLKDNDLVWIRNQDTGAIGRIIHGKLNLFPDASRATLALLDDKVRTNGLNITGEEFESLPKKNF